MAGRRIAPAAVLLLALGGLGCGLDTSEDAVVPPPAAPVTTGSTPLSTDGRSRFVHAPSVHGMPVRAARLRVAAERFRVEEGRRFGVVARRADVVELAPDEGLDRPVTSQDPQRPQPTSPGTTVALGTATVPPDGGRRPGLQAVGWDGVRFADGVLELRGVRWAGACGRVDHVQLGPPGGATRFARVWAQVRYGEGLTGCERAPRVLRLRPGADWTRGTVVWNADLERPRDDLRGVRRTRFAGAVVQPDRRTVMVRYQYGGCERLAGASIAVAGRRAAVDVRIGTAPPPAGTSPDEVVCPAILNGGTTVVRLDRDLPAGTRFVAAG